MNNAEFPCYIWDTPGTSRQQHPDRLAVIVRDSPRTGGEYEISDVAIRYIQELKEADKWDDRLKEGLTTLINEQRRTKEHRPQVTSELIEIAKSAPSPFV